MIDGSFALLLQIVNPAQENMGPGHDLRLLRYLNRTLEIAGRSRHIFVCRGHLGHDEQRSPLVFTAFVHRLIGENHGNGIGETDFDISPRALKARLDRGDDIFLLDVREPAEWKIARLEGAKLIPVNSMVARANELSTADEIVLYCKSGVRSARALHALRELGFRKLWNLQGGITAWANEVDRTMPRY